MPVNFLICLKGRRFVRCTVHGLTQMLHGLAYNPLDKELTEQRIEVRKLLHAYNISPPANFPEGTEAKLEITGSDRRELIAKIFKLQDGQENKIEIEPPLWLYVKFISRGLTFLRDYGDNVKFEGSFYCNFNTTILDCAKVTIGDGVLFGPK